MIRHLHPRLRSGNAQDVRSPAPVATAKRYITRPPHRFENISAPGVSGVALDSMTGQWCRTWAWNYIKKPDANDINTLPLCEQVFVAYPSEIEAQN